MSLIILSFTHTRSPQIQFSKWIWAKRLCITGLHDMMYNLAWVKLRYSSGCWPDASNTIISTKQSIWWICTFTCLSILVLASFIVLKWQWLSGHPHLCECWRFYVSAHNGLLAIMSAYIHCLCCLSIWIHVMLRWKCVPLWRKAQSCEEITKEHDGRKH